MLKKVTDLTSGDFSQGLNTDANILSLSKTQSPNMMDMTVNNDLTIEKRMGTSTQNALVITQTGTVGFSPDSSNLLLPRLQAYWKLDEVSGTRADSISTHNLQDENTVGQAGGIKRFAANFVAANSEYLIFNNTATLATGDVDFSISAWLNPTTLSASSQRTIVAKRDIQAGDSTLVLLLHMDGADGSTTFTDSELTPKTITANGNAQIDTAESKFGGASGLFDGSGDYLTAADSADWDFGTGNFTIDFWIRHSDVINSQAYISHGDLASSGFFLNLNSGKFQVNLLGANVIDYTWNPNADQWYHIEVSRSGSTIRLFIDGSEVASATDSSNITGATGNLEIGRLTDGNRALAGWLDEFRILKGKAAHSTSFTPATSAYTNPSTPNQFEYWLYLNTDNIITFEVSSSGTAQNGRVQASSFGAVGTSTWYSIVAWHDTGDRIGISVNLSVNTASYASGVRSGSAPFVIGAISNGAAAFLDGRVDEVGFWKKVLTTQNLSDIYNSGNGNSYNLSFARDSWASFDFGASNLRWVVVAAGTGLYASSNLGVTWVAIATDRTATYQYFDRSKASLIATSDAYDAPLQWAGSANTFATLLNTSAPLAKYSVNFQGFLILLNTSTRKRGFYYEDENSQLTGDWGDSFDIPSSADDEITGAFTLRKNLYVSTRYSLFRLTYIGGNPDWSYKKIKDWGYVPRTARVISAKDVGEVAMGLDWSRKLQFFDGSDDKIISTNIEHDNDMCDFAMDKISYALSGLTVSHAVIDSNENVYKLCLAIGIDSSSTTHTINFDGRTMAFYPYSNTPFNTMCMAESANRRHLLAFDRSGFCHMVDSGNLDANRTAINEVFDSPILFEKSPSSISKSQKIDLYFSPTSSGTLHYMDRVDFSSTFKERTQFVINNDGSKILLKQSIDIPQTAGVYQYRLTSSQTANPWRLSRTDYFLNNLGIGDSE